MCGADGRTYFDRCSLERRFWPRAVPKVIVSTLYLVTQVHLREGVQIAHILAPSEVILLVRCCVFGLKICEMRRRVPVPEELAFMVLYKLGLICAGSLRIHRRPDPSLRL